MESNSVYTNADLARDYITVISQKGISKVCVSQSQVISGSDVNLHSFYQEHGSLKTLKLKGIRTKTKDVLELILKDGVEKAAETILEEQNEKIRESWNHSRASFSSGRVNSGQYGWSDGGK